jgi:hypothetical protein
VAVGIASQPANGTLGWLLVAGGSVVSVVGAALIYVRSRTQEPR